MLKRNSEIREKQGELSNWMVAEKLGIHENTFYRWMRREMSKERKERVMAAIAEIKHELGREEYQND